MTSPRTGYELRAHTADLLLVAWGADLPDLFRSAAAGLYGAVGDLAVSDTTEPVRIALRATDVIDLLHDFLSELLFLFETRALVVRGVQFAELSDTVCRIETEAHQLDPGGSSLDREVKAVTYHAARVCRSSGGYEASLVLDI